MKVKFRAPVEGHLLNEVADVSRSDAERLVAARLAVRVHPAKPEPRKSDDEG